MMLDILPFTIFIIATVFHIYLGFGGPIRRSIILPQINGHPIPFDPLTALPMAGLFALSTISFGYKVMLLPNTLLGSFNTAWLVLTGIALLLRFLFSIFVVHANHQLIDDTEYKIWDLRLYSPISLYLGVASFAALVLH